MAALPGKSKRVIRAVSSGKFSPDPGAAPDPRTKGEGPDFLFSVMVSGAHSSWTLLVALFPHDSLACGLPRSLHPRCSERRARSRRGEKSRTAWQTFHGEWCCLWWSFWAVWGYKASMLCLLVVQCPSMHFQCYWPRMVTIFVRRPVGRTGHGMWFTLVAAT